MPRTGSYTEIYTLDEVRKLFSIVETAPMKYRTFFILSVYSGFRRGEMLGLEWKDVDFDNNVSEAIASVLNFGPKKEDTAKGNREDIAS